MRINQILQIKYADIVLQIVILALTKQFVLNAVIN